MNVCLSDHYFTGLCEGLQFIIKNSLAYKMMSVHPCVRHVYFVLNIICYEFLDLMCILYTPIVLALEYNIRERVPMFMFELKNECLFTMVSSVHRFHVFIESIDDFNYGNNCVFH